MIRYIVLSFAAIAIASLAAYAVFLAWPGDASPDVKSFAMGMVAYAVTDELRKAFKLDKKQLE